MINDPKNTTAASRPRGAVYANGELLEGLLSMEVDNNSNYQADTFRITLSLSGQPTDRGIDWWAQQEKLEMDLRIGFPADPENFVKNDLTSYLVGYADDIEIDLDGDCIVIAGRDLTSKLIDYRRTISFNSGSLVASDIVTKIAGEVGLTPVVTATSKASGSYYQIVKSLVTADSTYWDIVTRLAQIEQFQVYVKGHELHFEPKATASADPYVIQWTPAPADGGTPESNATRIRFSRNLSIAKDLKVRVLSFSQKTKSTVNEVAERKRVYNKTTSKAVPYTGAPQEYVYNIPNLTADQARAKAEAILEELSRHEMNLSAEMPGDDLLTPQCIVKVQGTGSVIDQTYYPTSITRSFSWHEGFCMHLTAKNQTPNTPA